MGVANPGSPDPIGTLDGNEHRATRLLPTVTP